MLGINAGEIKNKQNPLSTISKYSSSVERNQVGNSSGRGKKTGISSKMDSLYLSSEGIEMLQERKINGNPFLPDENKHNILDELMKSYREQLEASNDEKDGSRDMAKLMEIARRIAKGDKVPAKDEKKLLEFSPELYQAAKAAALLNVNKKHKEHDSLFDDEEKNDIRNKLNSLEQEDLMASVSGETAASDGTASIEAPSVE